MKVWFDKRDVNFDNFISEQFLLLPLFERRVINENKDFNNSEEWINEISKIVTYVSNPEDSDIIVYPNKLDSNITNYIDIVSNTSKKIICFYNDDNDKPSRLPSNVDIYRTSFYHSTRRKTEYSLPAWSCDFAKTVDLNYRVKELRPVIGFCGAITHNCRQQAIELLNQNNQIIKHFKIRNSFWGGDIHNALIRSEYIDHMIESDLILCCRGAGNFSYRLYECMSLGKIPVIINTDIVLPCDDIITWRDVGIWVNNLEDINQLINDYWSSITNEGYLEHQRLSRKIYSDFLSPAGFAKYLNTKYTNI